MGNFMQLINGHNHRNIIHLKNYKNVPLLQLTQDYYYNYNQIQYTIDKNKSHGNTKRIKSL